MVLERGQNGESVQDIVSNYLLLGNKYKNPAKVELVLASLPPDGTKTSLRDIAVTTAVQCNAPGAAKLKERSDEKSFGIEGSTLEAGHHTTRMHANFTWQIVGATRSVVHDVFHYPPFYNSEQQSQRYVEAKEGSYIVPADLTPEQENFYLEVAAFSNKAYFGLLEVLKPRVEERIRDMYPTDGWRVEKTRARLETKVKKISQEVARYVLPIGQLTTLYHTLNEISLLRLFRASQQTNFPDEARFIIGSMLDTVGKADPTIWAELEKPLLTAREGVIKEEYISAQKRAFDVKIGENLSLIQNPWGVNDGLLIDAVRNALALPASAYSDSEVLNILMSPGQNKLLADVYETGMLDPLTSALRQLSITFATKLSHTADSQRQRQRFTPGDTPPIDQIFDGQVDCITPKVIKETPQINEVYGEIMNKIFDDVNKAIQMGIPREQALLLLPNATAVRLTESGQLFDWLHRWKQRLCYLAQEEIFFISVEQVSQLSEILPESAQMLLAPCGVRMAAGIRPRCPEGDRWCGQPVFNWTLQKYKANRLI